MKTQEKEETIAMVAHKNANDSTLRQKKYNDKNKTSKITVMKFRLLIPNWKIGSRLAGTRIIAAQASQRAA